MLGNVLLILAGLVILLVLWTMIYDSTHFETTEYIITSPKIKKNCRAAVIADLHNQKYGRDNEFLLSAIRSGKPDFIFFVGDILTAKPKASLDTALSFVGELAKEYPIFYGVGNHEHRMMLYHDVYGDMADRYLKGLRENHVELMQNQRSILEEYGICVTGSMIHQVYYKRFSENEMQDDYLEKLLGRVDEMHYQILLAHNPDYFPQYASWGADLVLSGHVHGGVVRIPFWNRGVASPAVRLFPKYDCGLFREKNSTMLLSRGLGIHTIPFRLWNPGDLIFLSFQNGEEGVKKLEK